MIQELLQQGKENIKFWVGFAYRKFVKGQKEHGGNLREKRGMMRNIEMEIADLMHYVPTARYQLDKRVLTPMVESGCKNPFCIQAQDALIDFLSEDPN